MSKPRWRRSTAALPVHGSLARHHCCLNHLQLSPNLLWHLHQCKRRKEVGVSVNGTAVVLRLPLIKKTMVAHDFLITSLSAHRINFGCNPFWREMMTIDCFSLHNGRTQLTSRGPERLYIFRSSNMEEDLFLNLGIWDSETVESSLASGVLASRRSLPQSRIT